MGKRDDIEQISDDEDWEDLLDSRFLRGVDIGDRRPTVTIERIWKERVRKKRCVIIRMKGAEREWKVNYTNLFLLSLMFGSKPKKWVGRRVTLCAPIQTSFGKTKPAIRVYGSPELKEPIQAYKDLGEYIIKRTLHPTKNGGSSRSNQS
jgi:hypothetical protein